MVYSSLKNAKEFDNVFHSGKRFNSAIGQIIIKLDPNKKRFGIVVGKKIGGAVVRNRIKRVIRSAFRILSDGISCVEVVFLPNSRCADTGFGHVLSEMKAAFGKAGISITGHSNP